MRIAVDEISHHVAELFKEYSCVLAAFLMGSCARNEETYFTNAQGYKEMMSDYEMLIIVNSYSDTYKISESLQKLRNELAKERTSENFDIEWMYKSVNEIKRLDRRFIFFETKHFSKLIYGNIQMLDLFPEINIHNLNYSELNTVLLHRLYHVIRGMNSKDEHFKKYLIARNSLDFSTAFLPLIGLLVPSYESRTSELQKVAEKYELPEELVKRQQDYLIMKKNYDADQYNTYSYEQMLHDFYNDFMLLRSLQQKYQNGVLFKTDIRSIASAIYRLDINKIFTCINWKRNLTLLCDEMFNLLRKRKIDESELKNLKSKMKELFNYC